MFFGPLQLESQQDEKLAHEQMVKAIPFEKLGGECPRPLKIVFLFFAILWGGGGGLVWSHRPPPPTFCGVVQFQPSPTFVGTRGCVEKLEWVTKKGR